MDGSTWADAGRCVTWAFETCGVRSDDGSLGPWLLGAVVGVLILRWVITVWERLR